MRDTMQEKLTTEFESQIQDSVMTESTTLSMKSELTDSDREFMRSRYQVQIFLHDCQESDIREENYPYDCYLVTYQINNRTYNDLTRGPKRVTIFDAYYDMLNPIGGKVLQIKGWYGKINPKLWGNQTKKKK